jgi:hypothetical protein
MKIEFTTLLTVLFIGLKLGNVITWSWLWVLSPLWIGLVIALVVLLTVLIIAVISHD